VPSEQGDLSFELNRLTSKAHSPTSLNILLAEDDLINQTITVAMLDKLGYNVRLVDNGDGVLKAMHQENFDIILMDINMPGMDGVEATRRIRRMQLPRQPYIVAYTANAFTEERDMYLSSGMNECLTKPLQIDKLVEILDKAAIAALSGDETLCGSAG
jgi:CheY-like chemotaxis protein